MVEGSRRDGLSISPRWWDMGSRGMVDMAEGHDPCSSETR